MASKTQKRVYVVTQTDFGEVIAMSVLDEKGRCFGPDNPMPAVAPIVGVVVSYDGARDAHPAAAVVTLPQDTAGDSAARVSRIALDDESISAAHVVTEIEEGLLG